MVPGQGGRFQSVFPLTEPEPPVAATTALVSQVLASRGRVTSPVLKAKTKMSAGLVPSQAVEEVPPGLSLSLQSPGTPWLCRFRKNCTMWELWVKLYLGWDEDYSLRAGTSESSEKLLQRGWRRGRSIYMRFWWRGSSCYQALIFAKKFSASHKELMSPQRDVVLC